MTRNSKILIMSPVSIELVRMTPNQFYNQHKDTDRISAVCEAADTTVANFKQIAMAGGSVGRALAKRLSEASGNEMTILEILYPEDFEKAEESAA